ncbi:hypothetical protein DID75_03045 [Candidatus Marinamargulisbacteria bacterium SCGC AG-410-N11]|nr:hypothetical protein DID75_03045 [Candidatus Marinamargulisbacteria bacterium SCGC AG-410-N11]
MDLRPNSNHRPAAPNQKRHRKNPKSKHEKSLKTKKQLQSLDVIETINPLFDITNQPRANRARQIPSSKPSKSGPESKSRRFKSKTELVTLLNSDRFGELQKLSNRKFWQKSRAVIAECRELLTTTHQDITEQINESIAYLRKYNDKFNTTDGFFRKPLSQLLDNLQRTTPKTKHGLIQYALMLKRTQTAIEFKDERAAWFIETNVQSIKTPLTAANYGSYQNQCLRCLDKEGKPEISTSKTTGEYNLETGYSIKRKKADFQSDEIILYVTIDNSNYISDEKFEQKLRQLEALDTPRHIKLEIIADIYFDTYLSCQVVRGAAHNSLSLMYSLYNLAFPDEPLPPMKKGALLDLELVTTYADSYEDSKEAFKQFFKLEDFFEKDISLAKHPASSPKDLLLKLLNTNNLDKLSQTMTEMDNDTIIETIRHIQEKIYYSKDDLTLFLSCIPTKTRFLSIIESINKKPNMDEIRIMLSRQCLSNDDEDLFNAIIKPWRAHVDDIEQLKLQLSTEWIDDFLIYETIKKDHRDLILFSVYNPHTIANFPEKIDDLDHYTEHGLGLIVNQMFKDGHDIKDIFDCITEIFLKHNHSHPSINFAALMELILSKSNSNSLNKELFRSLLKSLNDKQLISDDIFQKTTKLTDMLINLNIPTYSIIHDLFELNKTSVPIDQGLNKIIKHTISRLENTTKHSSQQQLYKDLLRIINDPSTSKTMSFKILQYISYPFSEFKNLPYDDDLIPLFCILIEHMTSDDGESKHSTPNSINDHVIQLAKKHNWNTFLQNENEDGSPIYTRELKRNKKIVPDRGMNRAKKRMERMLRDTASSS